MYESKTVLELRKIAKGKKLKGYSKLKKIDLIKLLRFSLGKSSRKMSSKRFSTKLQTITLTFGDRAENHKGMEIIGKEAEYGFTYKNLKDFENYFTSLHKTCEFITLECPESDDHAYLLIIRNAFNYADELEKEQNILEKDKKAFMYGRVVNKKARWNLCFSDFSQEANYAEGKGTIINFQDLPYLNKLRKTLFNLTGLTLQCEGNYYYDIKKTYIGFHGDTERKIVIAMRLGESFPLHYRWYHESKPISDIQTYILNHGDMYFMSDKAVGYDWKSSSKYTLRHAAGDLKHLI